MSTAEKEVETENPPRKESTYLQAISQALWEELDRDPDVFLMGEDIGAYGGAFKVTDGFLDHFGPKRIVDTPLEETGFIGVAIGAALMGMRPVVEVQYADFISCGWDQIVNVAAKMHYRTAEAVPLVIRAPSGAGLRAGPFHSQSPEGWFAHVPGLKIVAPSTPHDAKGLLKSAIRDDNPVLFFEHKLLYRSQKEVIPDGDYTVPLGQAKIVGEGSDVTIVTYGAMLFRALQARDLLEQKGISVEVLDLRTLAPLDKQSILRSVEKTSRLLVLHEDTRTLGIGAEIGAIVADEGFQYLDAPIRRLTAPDTPVPYSPPLEDEFLPQTERIVATVEELVSF